MNKPRQFILMALLFSAAVLAVSRPDAASPDVETARAIAPAR